MSISKHFKRYEFACKCACGFDTADIETVAVLEDVRQHFGSPVMITSFCRCEKHNKSVGGSASSQHLLGRAADIVVSDVPAIDVYNYLDKKYTGIYGLGSYSNFTHVDTRGMCARWEG